MTYREWMSQAHDKYMRWLVAESGGSMTKAAEIADLNRQHLYLTMRRAPQLTILKRRRKLGKWEPQKSYGGRDCH